MRFSTKVGIRVNLADTLLDPAYPDSAAIAKFGDLIWKKHLKRQKTVELQKEQSNDGMASSPKVLGTKQMGMRKSNHLWHQEYAEKYSRLQRSGLSHYWYYGKRQIHQA